MQSQAGFSNQTPVSTKRGGKKRTHEASDVDEMYLEHLNKIAKRAEDDNDPDVMFLRSLLPSIKQLSPLKNLEFKGEVISSLKQKLHFNQNYPYHTGMLSASSVSDPYSPGTDSYQSAPTPTPTFTQDHNPPINDITFQM